MKYSYLINPFLFLSLFASIIVSSCSSDIEQEDLYSEEVDSMGAKLLEIDGQVFSIPSPIQTAFLIQEVGTTYNSEYINRIKNIENYSTNFQKALNLGIYGADLGYVTIYDQTQTAITYFTVIKKLADDLGVSNAFDQNLIGRFEKNIGHKDSLLVLVSEAYKVSDSYLKSQERDDFSSLILAGGWIESLYFTTQVAKATNNKAIVIRIGEQKTTLNNLIKLLTPFYRKPEFKDLIDKLLKLKQEYDGVTYTYKYEKPTTFPQQKLTILNSSSSVDINAEQLKRISEIITEIRAEVIG